jgi:hypothetical protein
VIKDEDARLHEPTTTDPLWAETNYFGLYVHEPAINIGVYALFRATVGAVGSTVSVNSRRVTMPWAADYWDAWQHIPMTSATDLLDYALPNGLRVRCREPNRVWDVDFDDPDGQMSLHFRYTALMAGYDINDPEMDPLAARRDMDKTWGHAYAGHFDQTGRYEGELELRGRRHTIDCVSTMDHSWGVRAERQTSRMSWLHAHVSPDLALHAILDFSTDNGPDGLSPLRLTHGYVLDHGTCLGLAAGEGEASRSGFYPQRVELRLTDAQGRGWELSGRALTTFPWQAWPGTVGHNCLLRWQVRGPDGAPGGEGLGEAMDFIGVRELSAVYSRA